MRGPYEYGTVSDLAEVARDPYGAAIFTGELMLYPGEAATIEFALEEDADQVAVFTTISPAPGLRARINRGWYRLRRALGLAPSIEG